MKHLLKHHSIIPDLFPKEFEFKANLKVLFKSSGVQLDSANTSSVAVDIAPKDAKDLPHFSLKYLEEPAKSFPQQSMKDLRLAMCMVDPDAPSRSNPSNAQWLHYLCVDIPLSSQASGESSLQKHEAHELLLNKGNEICSFMGPSPPKGTGPHRYAFFIFHYLTKKDKFKDMNQYTSGNKGRQKFNIHQFSQ